MFNPELVFDVNNGITLNFEVHQEIHKLIRDGVGFEEAIQHLKEKYGNLPSNQGTPTLAMQMVDENP
jgi:hypothetical protein